METLSPKRKVLTWIAVVIFLLMGTIVNLYNKYSGSRLPVNFASITLVYLFPSVILALCSGLVGWRRSWAFESKQIFMDYREKRNIAIVGASIYYALFFLVVGTIGHFTFAFPTLSRIPLFLFHYFCAALFEEMMFKGCAFRLLSDGKESRIGLIVLLSFFFAFLHRDRSLVAYMSIFCFQFFSLLIYDVFPSVLLATVLHWLDNMTLLFLVYGEMMANH